MTVDAHLLESAQTDLEFRDGAASGASVHQRDGLQKLMADAKNGCFEAIYADALDRLSRDQADTATIYKRLRYYGVKLVTLEEEEINAMHVGFKDPMNETFLEALAVKTRRGMEGQVRDGCGSGGRKRFSAPGGRMPHGRIGGLRRRSAIHSAPLRTRSGIQPGVV